MKLFGLTGGVGMGKTTVGDLLRQSGVPVIDTDLLARQVVEPGQPAALEIRNVFGECAFDAEGRLRRDELARLVFADPDARRRLEAILHPQIRAAWLAQAQRWREEQQRLGIVIIPLLFETAAAPRFDGAICVACSAESQFERLRGRGWSPEEIQRRIQAQWPIEKKIANSDFLVWTDTSLEVVAAQLREIGPEFRVK